jgi:hypothetical protein
LEGIQKKGGRLGVVYLYDHGASTGQSFGNHKILETDPNGELTDNGERDADALQRIGKTMSPNGVIILGGCAAGYNEAYLILAAQKSGRRVRGDIGWCRGFTSTADHPGMWAEANKYGSITYYETGEPTAKPKYRKMRDNPKSTRGRFIIYGDSEKYHWKQTKEGVVIYDSSGKPKYKQTPEGNLVPYDGESTEKGKSQDDKKGKGKGNGKAEKKGAAAKKTSCKYNVSARETCSDCGSIEMW